MYKWKWDYLTVAYMERMPTVIAQFVRVQFRVNHDLLKIKAQNETSTSQKFTNLQIVGEPIPVNHDLLLIFFFFLSL